MVQVNGRIVPVQVTWAQPLERHHRALEEFYEGHPQADEAVFVAPARFPEALSAIGDA